MLEPAELADTDHVGALRREVVDAAARLDAIRASIHVGLRGAYWFGEHADAARLSWESDIGPAISETADLLRTLAVTMKFGVVDNANE